MGGGLGGRIHRCFHSNALRTCHLRSPPFKPPTPATHHNHSHPHTLLTRPLPSSPLPGAAPRVADPNLPSHRGQGGRVFFARAGNRVLSARLSMRGREVVDRTYGVARGIVPGLEAP